MRSPQAALLDPRQQNLQWIKELEDSVLILRSASLSSAKNARRNRYWQKEASSLDEEAFLLRVKEAKSLMDNLPVPLLQGLRDVGMKSKELKSRMFKRTLDFGLVFRENALDSISYFYCTLGLSEEQVIKIFNDEPTNANRNCIKSVDPKIRWLQKLGCDWRTIVVGYVSKGAFRCSLKKLQANFDWMKGLGITHSMCVDMMRHQPALLRRNVDSLDEKVFFAVTILNKDILDIVRWPAYLTYSLQNRIMLRTAFSMEMNVDFDFFPFVSAIGASDAYFCNMRIFGADQKSPTSLSKFFKFKDWWMTLTLDDKFRWITSRKDKQD